MEKMHNTHKGATVSFWFLCLFSAISMSGSDYHNQQILVFQDKFKNIAHQYQAEFEKFIKSILQDSKA